MKILKILKKILIYTLILTLVSVVVLVLWNFGSIYFMQDSDAFLLEKDSYSNLTTVNQDVCTLHKSNFNDFYTVDVEQVKCLARNSDKPFTIFFSFASWCSGCSEDLPKAVKFANEIGSDFYILLIDRECDNMFTYQTVQILQTKRISAKTVILSDSLYSTEKLRKPQKRSFFDLGIQRRDKYSNFIKQITPPQFEKSIDEGMGKFFIFNNKGDIIYINSHNDYYDENGNIVEDYNYFLNKIRAAIKEK